MEKDNITYEHRHSNFVEAKSHSMKLLGMLKGCIAMNGEHVDIDVGGILANIGSPDMQGVEKFILKWVTAKDVDNNLIQLDKVDVFNTHFNTYRSHYYPLIVNGLIFHFSDFLPDGVASKVNMPSLVSLTA
ncbi:putative phage tail assembly chaperone [Providencia manganoxydans]|uniref:putative phage tail assembly chaperone n=1 Tax=Providencia manganoxydans TaxID=2923283 RepID=UPI0032DB43DC